MLRLFRAVGRRMGKTGKAFYAVRVGRQAGVYTTWEECQHQVKGYPGAVFKGFPSMEEAQSFIHSSTSAHARTAYSGRRPGLGGHQPTRPHTSNGAILCTSAAARPLAKPRGISSKTAVQHKYLGTQPNSEQLPAVYSDGCCFGNGRRNAKAGIGVYWGHNHPCNISERLSGTQTNQRAELVSAYRAIESAVEQGYTAVEVKTDSTYTIKAATEWIKKWKKNGWQTSTAEPVKNKEDIVTLDKACQKISVKWTHVPGHCGVVGNEAADQLAKAGAQLTL